MTPERWAQIEELFHRAWECEPERRTGLLHEVCSDDPELRREVESLLSCQESAADHLKAAVNFGLDAVGFPLVGQIISHYRVLHGLGEGGMGFVYRAEDIKLGRKVALKFLPEDSESDPAALGRFDREARAASALEHPNICPIYEFGEHEGKPFIVMQLMEGQTLRELIAATNPGKPPFEIEKLLDLAIQIVDGLIAAHEKGIIHRDIKPANIFVTSQSQAKILDFGLAKLAPSVLRAGDDSVHDHQEADPRETLGDSPPLATPDLFLSQTGVAMGTAGYMSPEQVRGETVDCRTDLFSFGLVLYEMATGQRAFSGETSPAVRDAILEQVQPSVRELNPEIPPTLEGIIDRALEKNRELRYQSASEMRTALQSESDALHHVTNRGSSSEKILRSSLRNWVLLITTVTLLIFGSWLLIRTRQQPALGETDKILISDFVNTTGDPIFDGSLKQALTVKLAESPYFNIMPEWKIKETLTLIGRSSDERVLPQVARDLCERGGGKVLVSGSIKAIRDKYFIDVDATNCLSGTNIVHEESEAQNRDEVLSNLGKMIPHLRLKLGELVGTIQKFNTPIEQATTKSLAALKAFTSGDEQRATGGG